MVWEFAVESKGEENIREGFGHIINVNYDECPLLEEYLCFVCVFDWTEVGYQGNQLSGAGWAVCWSPSHTGTTCWYDSCIPELEPASDLQIWLLFSHHLTISLQIGLIFLYCIRQSSEHFLKTQFTSTINRSSCSPLFWQVHSVGSVERLLCTWDTPISFNSPSRYLINHFQTTQVAPPLFHAVPLIGLSSDFPQFPLRCYHALGTLPFTSIPPYQPFPIYSSGTALIPCCPPHQTFFGLFSVSIWVFPCSSHYDTIMFSIISTACWTAQQVKWIPMDSQSQCSGLWAEFGDFLLSFVHSMCYSSQITCLCSLPLNNYL